MPRSSASIVLAAVLLAASARAEFPLNADRPLAPALGRSHDALVAATDSGFLALWTTEPSYVRGSAYPRPRSEGLTQVGRYSPDGALERRATAWELPASVQLLDAASNGETVVAAGKCRDASAAPACIARFSAAGDFLGMSELPVRSATNIRVASDGEAFLVLLGHETPREVLAVPFSADGTAGTPVLLHPWGASPEALAVTSLGGRYFATLGFLTERILVRISDEGIEKSVRLDLPGTATANLAVSGSGDRLLVTATLPSSALFAIYDADLNLVSGWSSLEARLQTAIPAPVSSGWIAATSSAGYVTAVPIDFDGGHGTPHLVAFSSNRSAAAGRNDRAAIVWTTLAPTENDVRLAIIGEDGAPILEPRTISVGPAPQLDPAGAHAGGVTLAAWRERREDGTFIVKVRPFDANGAPLAPPVPVPFRGAVQAHPSVASNGASFFVVWSEGPCGADGIRGARVSPAGALLDREAIRIFGAASPPYEGYRTASVDWSGERWIVATSDENRRIVVRRVSPAGSLVDVPVRLSPQRREAWASDFAPVIDCNGAECLVAWKGPPLPDDCQLATCEPPPPSVLAARIGPALALLDREPLLLSREWEFVSELGVSWNEVADAWLVTWSAPNAQRVARNGTLLPRDAGAYRSPGSRSAVAEREGWRMVWRSGAGRDLFHAWSPTGSIDDASERFFLTRTPHREWGPRLVAAPRPLALFVRESQIDAGSPSVVGAFLDEATEADEPEITLAVDRVQGRQLLLSWVTAGDVVGFSPEGLVNGQWSPIAYTRVAEQAVLVTQDRATTFRIRASTSSGFEIHSNEAEAPPIRRRVAGREDP